MRLLGPKALHNVVTTTVGPVCFRYSEADGGATWEVKVRGEDDGEIVAPLRSTPTELVKLWQARGTLMQQQEQTEKLRETMTNQLGGDFEVLESSWKQ